MLVRAAPGGPSMMHLLCLARVGQRSACTLSARPSVGPPDHSEATKTLSRQLSAARRAGTVQRLQRPLPPAAEVEGPVAADLSVEPPTNSDLRVIVERQLGYTGNATEYNVFAVGCRCKHGYPQAFAFNPLTRSTPSHHRNPLRRAPVDSGLFRLSCPWLVKAIDEWEAEVRTNTDVRLTPNTHP